MTQHLKKPKLYTIKEAAELIDGLTAWRIRKMCQSGKINCFMADSKYMFTEDALFKAVFGDNSQYN
jgi:hypothetical protein